MAADNQKESMDEENSTETRPIPSQAEGDDPPTSGEGNRPVPSQAEGDEETVEQSLRQKEGKR